MKYVLMSTSLKDCEIKWTIIDKLKPNQRLNVPIQLNADAFQCIVEEPTTHREWCTAKLYFASWVRIKIKKQLQKLELALPLIEDNMKVWQALLRSDLYVVD